VRLAVRISDLCCIPNGSNRRCRSAAGVDLGRPCPFHDAPPAIRPLDVAHRERRGRTHAQNTHGYRQIGQWVSLLVGQDGILRADWQYWQSAQTDPLPQIESSALPAHVGRREIDRDGLIPIAEAGVDRCAIDALTAFAYRGIRHANHDEVARRAGRAYMSTSTSIRCA
jgi:hypothetical protein